MSAALPVTDCDGCTGDRCPGACPVLAGERVNAEEARDETLRKALAALAEQSAALAELRARFASLRFVHGETSEALERVLAALGVDGPDDAVLRIAELLAIADMKGACVRLSDTEV